MDSNMFFTYDTMVLKKQNAIDIDTALKNFGSNQSFFKALDKFIEESNHYLRGFSPTVVAYSEDMRKDFLIETNNLQKKFISLGMIYLASTLADINNAADSGNATVLSDRIGKLYAEIDIMATSITSARN